jgi:sugar phosphate isomerase/epimerase
LKVRLLPLDNIPAATSIGVRANIEDNGRAIDQAATLGAARFVLVVRSLPPGSRNLPDARNQVAESVGLMLEHPRAVAVRLALESLYPRYANDRSCLNTLAHALDSADEVESTLRGAPMLGVAVDLYHIWWDPARSGNIERAGAARRIFGFHICYWLAPTRDLLTDWG